MDGMRWNEMKGAWTSEAQIFKAIDGINRHRDDMWWSINYSLSVMRCGSIDGLLSVAASLSCGS